HDRVKPFFATEVFVHHGLRHAGARGNIFHAASIKSLLRECRTANGNQLLTALLASHSLSCHGYSLANNAYSSLPCPSAGSGERLAGQFSSLPAIRYDTFRT